MNNVSITHKLGFKLKNISTLQSSPISALPPEFISTSPLVSFKNASLSPFSNPPNTVLIKTLDSSSPSKNYSKSSSIQLSMGSPILNSPAIPCTAKNIDINSGLPSEKTFFSQVPTQDDIVVEEDYRSMARTQSLPKSGFMDFKKSPTMLSCRILNSPKEMYKSKDGIPLNQPKPIVLDRNRQRLPQLPLQGALLLQDESHRSGQISVSASKGKKKSYYLHLSPKEISAKKLFTTKNETAPLQFHLFNQNMTQKTSTMDSAFCTQIEMHANEIDLSQMASRKDTTRIQSDAVKTQRTAADYTILGDSSYKGDAGSVIKLKHLLKPKQQPVGGLRLYQRSFIRKDRKPEGELSTESEYVLVDRQRALFGAKSVHGEKSSANLKELEYFKGLKTNSQIGTTKNLRVSIHSGVSRKKTRADSMERLVSLKDTCRGVVATYHSIDEES